ncbi:MAG: hypothetical protein KDA61_11340, partial [Planctomycetales bacterium]|nr:hypothetical protein [Planctomycetales bacterium]
MQRRFTRFAARGAASMLVAAATVTLASPQALAALAHRYSFDSDITDSVGGANGTVVDAGSATNFVFAGGQIDLSANTGEGSNGITEDAYVDLPNGIISAASNNGTAGAVSFEMWATVSEQHTWQRFWDFGTSDLGEDTSSNGGASGYILATPNSGRYNNGLEITNHPASNAAEPNVGVAGPFANNVQTHVVGVYDHNDTTAGPNGTMTLYQNGVAIGTNQIHPDIDLRTFNDNNVWLGRSQWNDATFAGRYNEFRIYNHALSAGEALFNAVGGPDNAASGNEVLALEVNANTGAVTLINKAPFEIGLDYYAITSDGNALSTAGWNSLADKDGLPNPGAGWDEAGGASAGQLIELYLGNPSGNLFASIGANAEISLGNAFNPAVFGAGNDGDLEFAFRARGLGGLVSGSVTYVGEPGLPGDANGDGTVDVDDLNLVLGNWMTAEDVGDFNGDGVV